MSELDERYPDRFKYFSDPVRKKREIHTRLYEYELPFKYPNADMELECEPVDGWRRSDEVSEAMPVRMRVDNLWGMLLRGAEERQLS